MNIFIIFSIFGEMNKRTKIAFSVDFYRSGSTWVNSVFDLQSDMKIKWIQW